MAFRFKKASCVVVGTFNMYIVQPAWLAKIGLLPAGVVMAIGTKLDEPGFRFSSPKLQSRWFVTPNRIEVETTSPEENCGELVARVLEKLPWTPLVGIGNNTIYTADLSELGLLPSLACFSPPVPSGYALVQRSFHMAVRNGEDTFNLQLSILEGEIGLSANAHRELRNCESQVAQEMARRFFDHRTEAENLMRDIYQAGVEYASGND